MKDNLMDSRYAPLFEPIQLGPVVAKNRFYQVPHCNGVGDWSPQTIAAMRGMKAEGGWGVVCTENLMVDAWSDINPFPAVRLWDDNDVQAQELTVEKIHEHGALAGCELAHFGMAASNRLSRNVPIGPSSRPTLESFDPVQSRAMDLSDIRAFRKRHREAAKRAQRAGFDIVYIYCSHENSIVSQFFSPKLNDRVDEYGGSLKNRMRLFIELIEDTHDAVGDTCAIAIRFSTAQLQKKRLIEREDLRAIIENTANLPDLWDVNVNDWAQDSATSRFAGEGHQEPLISFVREVSDKPVVGVGRFTSPDTMVSQLRRGVLDLIGAARPSIADPFLPNKIAEDRVDEIRECIGCNICVSGENSFSTMRCTQNPTMMEEWSRGWHPEQVPPAKVKEQVLIVGSGPAGLECALTLAKRGLDVAVAEGREEFGGRVLQESGLPGLGEWLRVRDYRLHALKQMPNVELYHSSPLQADDVLSFDASHIILATGAKWRRDGVGRTHLTAIPDLASKFTNIITPDDVMTGKEISGHVVLYDDDGAYLPAALAEALIGRGCSVTIVTPHQVFARWTTLTLEQRRLRERLVDKGVRILCELELVSSSETSVRFQPAYGSELTELPLDHLLLVTARTPKDELYNNLKIMSAEWQDTDIQSLTAIGDCLAPGLIAHAVFAGHRYGMEFGEKSLSDVPYHREVMHLGPPVARMLRTKNAAE